MIIYAIEHIETGRQYVGQTIADPNFHWNQYRSYLQRNKFHNNHLQNVWNRDGVDAFRFIILDMSAKNQDELNELEITFVDAQGYYNIIPGGNAGAVNRPWLGKKLSQQHKDKISKSTKESMARWKVEYSKRFMGAGNPASKLTTEQAIQIIALRKSGKKLKHLSDVYDVAMTTISDVCTGKTWSHLPRM